LVRSRSLYADLPTPQKVSRNKRASAVSNDNAALADLPNLYSVVMETQFIIFYEDEEHYLNEEGMNLFFKRSSRQLAEAFQSTAVYLDLAKELDIGTLPFFKTRIEGSQAAYDRLKLELVERVGEEKTLEIEEQVLTAIQNEKDESAG
jgi:hypothetical protein